MRCSTLMEMEQHLSLKVSVEEQLIHMWAVGRDVEMEGGGEEGKAAG